MRYLGEVLSTYYIGRLKSLGALEQFIFNCFALIQRAVAVLLNGGKMYKHVLSCRALDKPVSLRPVEPLHSTFLSHKNSFRLVAEIFFRLLCVVLGKQDTPSKDGQNSVANRVRAYAPTQTAPEVPSLNRMRRNGMEPRDEGAKYRTA